MTVLKGKLLDPDGKPVQSELELAVFTGICQENILARAETDANGYFKLEYPVSSETLILRFFSDEDLLQVVEIPAGEEVFDLEVTVSTQNIAITGRVVDEEGQPLPGLMVTALDVDIGPDDFLGCAWTDNHGEYFISYSSTRYNFQLDDKGLKEGSFNPLSLNPLDIVKKAASMIDREPDIVVKVHDKLGVFVLKETEEYSGVKEIIKPIDDVVIPQAWVEGWHVTLDDNLPSRLTHNNTFRPLIDNERALEEIIKAVEKARSYIYLTQFEFRPDFMAQPHREGETGVTLAEKLLDATQKGVKVRILINQNLLIPDDYDEIAELFQDTSVLVRPFNAQGPHVMHAKIFLVDGEEAFIIGSPFTQSYWDTVKHHLHDLRRGSRDKQPVHDVSIHIKGGSVPFIEEYFLGLWNHLSETEYDGQDRLEPHAEAVPVGNHSLQLVRSITPRTLTHDGEKGVLEMYRRAIGNAQEFIYMENQYFTNRYIAEALKSAIERNPDLQLILVINGNPDVPTYRLWQHRRLKKLGLDVDSPILDHPQIGVFNLWGIRPVENKFSLQPFYVHSKVSMADDKWATIGTANLDGSSLSGAEEFKQVTNPEVNLNMEINAMILDTEEPASGPIREFREELWGEHLGRSKMIKPDGGWLKLWKDVALKNVELLQNDEPSLQGHILPYTPARNAVDKIKSLGISNQKLNIMD